ncbi:MAG: bifunctional proline dehydrogenase/L-glutamate gamma-semialdehyde dehydrogenase PutA [Rickettsiales bacterium]|nr:bifunctional proline dehydrogenase/L-glutamate gamma-semialdehyde dehydrogenase PutA [Rickettsiales bacterium]
MHPQIKEISKFAFTDEDELISNYLNLAGFYKGKAKKIYEQASIYVQNIRENLSGFTIENFLKEFSLDTYEGVAILCLAEALLRIPDSKNADELIKDKILKGNWKEHLKKDSDLMLNISSFAFLLSEEVLSPTKVENKLVRKLNNSLEKASEPIIREALKKAVELLGGKFVIGNNIDKALKKAESLTKDGYNFSFDMLGEGARTESQAEIYFNNYFNGAKKLIEKWEGKLSDDIFQNPNISIKISALHPKYELLKFEKIKDELIRKILKIAVLCKENNLWLSIDAEESWRLEVSLLLYLELINHPALAGYNGLGFVVQAYGKRALRTIKFLNSLAEQKNIIIPIRLVKGAYWDSEIKYAQMNGLEGYPVFTRKSHTDLSYLVCAEELMKSKNIYPQFATHSAYSVSAIQELARCYKTEKFEFQKLFGMGDELYNQVISKFPCRIYAPVGSYEDLLPYLIRRILENGANNSFISLVADNEKSLDEILKSPISKIETKTYTGKFIPLPESLYNPRKNSKGYCLGNIIHTEKLKSFLNEKSVNIIEAKSLFAGKEIATKSQENIEIAINFADKNQQDWQSKTLEERCISLEKFADLLEENTAEIFNILVFEAKKTAKDSIGEIREAIDFLRFYASEARKNLTPTKTKSYTGEATITNYRGKGIFVCISPWNFPLAIFLGQISACLVAGNQVIAKPAEQTEKIAYYAVKLAYQAGIPNSALQLLLGKGCEIGSKLTSQEKIAGVVFTGSTQTARNINQNLAQRNSAIATFVAETGGQNAMIIDSTILLEKTLDDIIESAFHSAGQRCSALRVCYIQDEIYNKMLTLLKEAISELEVNNPQDFSTEIPPVIDAKAKENLEKHIATISNSFPQKRESIDPRFHGDEKEFLIQPTIIEIPSISVLEKENFGPILHLIKFKKEDTDKIISEINSTGYGLTFGIQSRIQDYIKYVTSRIHAGNIYINRSMIGAVVETHPFGGANLSGTGPKAGGVNYIKRFAEEFTITENTAAIGGNLELLK